MGTTLKSEYGAAVRQPAPIQTDGFCAITNLDTLPVFPGSSQIPTLTGNNPVDGMPQTQRRGWHPFAIGAETTLPPRPPPLSARQDFENRNAKLKLSLHGIDFWEGEEGLPADVDALRRYMLDSHAANAFSNGLSVEDIQNDPDFAELQRGALSTAEAANLLRDTVFPKPSLTADVLKCGLQRRMDDASVPPVRADFVCHRPDYTDQDRADPAGAMWCDYMQAASAYAVASPVPDLTFGYNKARAFSATEQDQLCAWLQDPRVLQHDGAPLLPFFTVHFHDMAADRSAVEDHKPLLSTSCCANTVEMANLRVAAKAAADDVAAGAAPGDTGYAENAMSSIAFGATVSRHIASLYMTWGNHSRTSRSSFHTITMGTFAINQPHDLLAFRRIVRNIAAWGQDARLTQVKGVLERLHRDHFNLPSAPFQLADYGLAMWPADTAPPRRVAHLIETIKVGYDRRGALVNDPTPLSGKERRHLEELCAGAAKPEVESFFRQRILPVTGLPDALATSERLAIKNTAFPPRVRTGEAACTGNDNDDDDDDDVARMAGRPADQASMPVPDLIYGYSPQDAFPRPQHLRLLDDSREGVRTIANRTCGFLYPFFTVHFADGDGDRGLAREACLKSSAACVHLVDRLASTAINCAAFGLVASHAQVELFVTWKSDDGAGEYYMASVKACSTGDLARYASFRMMVSNIIEWGANERLDSIEQALDAAVGQEPGADTEAPAVPIVY